MLPGQNDCLASLFHAWKPLPASFLHLSKTFTIKYSYATRIQRNDRPNESCIPALVCIQITVLAEGKMLGVLTYKKRYCPMVLSSSLPKPFFIMIFYSVSSFHMGPSGILFIFFYLLATVQKLDALMLFFCKG
jgi:hypothetical protein